MPYKPVLSVQGACAAALAIAALMAAGCGSSASSSHGSSQASQGVGTSAAGASGSAAGALSADARSAATGDIPDNQVFLVFVDGPSGYSIKYPEGWTQSGSGRDVSFHDKNNVVHIVVSRGAAPTPASVTTQLQGLKRSNATLASSAPKVVALGASMSVKATYTTQSPADPVTGKRVTLIVDRYELGHGGRVAVVDLGTPKGVDNVDAYRKMIESFRWR